MTGCEDLLNTLLGTVESTERGAEMTQAEKKPKFSYGKYYKEIDNLHALQTAPQERDWLLSAPKGDVKPAKVVLYLGCNVLRTAHLVRTVVDVFKMLDVDFVAVGGGSYCCGIQHFQNGDTEAARSVAATTVKSFEKFNPERVVMWCPSCIFFYDEIMGMRDDFPFQHVTEFLVENLDRLDFRPKVSEEVAEKVTLHYHTGRPQSDEEARCALKLLSQVPGVDLLDLGTDPQLGRHCTARVQEQVGAQEWDWIVSDHFRRAVEAGVDTYTTLYHGCQRIICGYEKRYPLKVEHYLTVVGKALGIEHEDLFKKYVLMGDAEAILAETSPCAQASGLTLEEAGAVIQKTFVEGNVS